MRRAILSSVAIFLSVACAAPRQDGGPLVGAWAGDHISLSLEAGGGVVEFDCAAGTIDQPVLPGASGRFTVQGSFSPGHGGPVRIDEVQQRLPAQYDGRVSGGQMSLTLRSQGNPQVYTLKRGEAPRLTRCL